MIELVGRALKRRFGAYMTTEPRSPARHEDVVRLLLHDQRIHLNQQCAAGWSALMYAAARGQTAAVKDLLARPEIEVDMMSTFAAGRASALMIAAGSGHGDIVDLLLQAPGININQRSGMGKTALLYAVEADETEVVRLLLAEPALDVNQCNSNDHSPLVVAAALGHTSIVCELLLAPGLDPSWCDARGLAHCAPLKAAVDGNRLPVVDLLMRTVERRLRMAPNHDAESLQQSYASWAHGRLSSISGADVLDLEAEKLLCTLLAPTSLYSSWVLPAREGSVVDGGCRYEEDGVDGGNETLVVFDDAVLRRETTPQSLSL